MPLKLIFNIISISSIFSKEDEELDILPPKPVFPELGEDDEKIKEAKRIIEPKGRQRQREKRLEELGKRKEEKRRKKEEEERGRKKLEEGRRKEEGRKQKEAEKARKAKERKEKIFKFFHDLGLVKTEEEKKEIEKRKKEEKIQRELEKKKKEEERKKELEKQRAEEERRKREEEEKKKVEKEMKELEEERKKRELELKREKEKKKRIKEETEFAKELREMEKIAPKPVKEEKKDAKAKLEMPELISLKTKKFEKEITKPEEVVKADEEIQKAISGIKKVKRPFIKKLFRKKKPAEDAWKVTDSSDSLSGTNYVGKVEIPEVMPRTYDKIDHVELIEEKIYKARLALMDFKFDDAKKVYIEIMKSYNELEPKKKSKVYQGIKDLYYERKSAEKFVK